MKKIPLIFLFLLICSTANATPYFVNQTSGNDNNNGTSTGAAWKTVSKVNSSSFSGGDTISFNKGDTWAEQLTVPSSGSVGNVITFNTYGSGAAPKLTGDPTLRVLDINNKNYITVTGLELDATGVTYDAVKIEGTSSYIILTNCLIHNAPQQGILTTTLVNNVSILNNTIYSNGTDISHDHGVYIEGPNNLVSRNTVYSNKAYGIQIYNDGGGSSSNTINYNNIYSNGNVTLGITHGGGIVLTDTSGSAYYNSIHDNTLGIYCEIACLNNTIYNNTITGNTKYGLYTDAGSTNLIFRNNIIYNNAVADWQDESSVNTTQDHNLIGVDPVFISASNYNLQATSTAINAGLDLGLHQDYAGTQIISAPDIGAYETSFSSYSNTSLKNSKIRRKSHSL